MCELDMHVICRVHTYSSVFGEGIIHRDTESYFEFEHFEFEFQYT